MMLAMMLPGAAPMLLLFARVNRSHKAQDRPYVPTGIFAAGYLAAWGRFSLLAAALQSGLEQLDLVVPMMTTTNYWLGGAILLAAGLWQLTPLKGVCLRHCRSPLALLAQQWRPGQLGAFRMGLEHGAYCLGCCWFLMGLLFFGGIMNLFWIAGLALFVLLEKTIPMGHWFGRGWRRLCRVGCADARQRSGRRITGDWLSGGRSRKKPKNIWSTDEIWEADMAEIPQWHVAGDWFDVCSCDIACSCIFGQTADKQCLPCRAGVLRPRGTFRRCCSRQFEPRIGGHVPGQHLGRLTGCGW